MLAKRQYEEITALPVRPQGLLRAPSLYAVAALAVLGAVFLVGLAPRLDTDFWWHLKVGQYITAHHVVPSRDFMSYTFTGHPWTDHEWLAEIGLYGLYRLAGLWGPITFFALVIFATWSLVYANMVARNVNRVLALFLMVVAFASSTASWGPRIQMISLFFLAAYMLLLYRFEVTRDRRLLAAFPAIMLLWANIHGGFVLGLVVLGITLAGEVLNHGTKRDNAFSAADLQALGLALAATFAVTIVNPNGFRQLLYPLTFVLPNAFTNQIQESASPNFHMPVMMIFEVLLLALVITLYLARHRLNWTHLLLIVAFTHLALSQVRNVPIWAVVISPLLAMYLAQALGLEQHARRLAGGIKSVVNVALLALLLLTYVVEARQFISTSRLRQVEAAQFPRGAVSYMSTHRLPPRVFVSYSWGGYLLWHLFPRYRDYMDSRADTLFTSAILDGYMQMWAARPGWKQDLNRYRVQDVLVERNAPLGSVLAEDPTWRLAYHDATAVLYTRR